MEKVPNIQLESKQCKGSIHFFFKSKVPFKLGEFGGGVVATRKLFPSSPVFNLCFSFSKDDQEDYIALEPAQGQPVNPAPPSSILNHLHHHHYHLSPSSHPPTYHHSPQTLTHDTLNQTTVPPELSTVCPKHGNTSIRRENPIKRMLGVEKPVLPSNKPKEKDTKEIMKKRRERAICIVSKT